MSENSEQCPLQFPKAQVNIQLSCSCQTNSQINLQLLNVLNHNISAFG